MTDYDLGIKKLDYWKFENEWRYRICIYKEYINVLFNQKIEEILVGSDELDEKIEEIKLFLEAKKVNIPILKSAIKINPK